MLSRGVLPMPFAIKPAEPSPSLGPTTTRGGVAVASTYGALAAPPIALTR